MKITFACYESLSIIHGGPRVQILQTKKELENLGVTVDLMDPWSMHAVNTKQPVHLFSANVGTFHLASVFHQYGIPFVTSPIFFTRHSPAVVRSSLILNRMLRSLRSGIWTNYEFTRQICAWSRGVAPNTSDERSLIVNGMGITPERVDVIPNGVERRFKHGDPALFRKQYGLDNFILNVGHIGPERKNVLNLIRALKSIDHPSVIIGKITEGDYARRCIAEAKKAKQIHIISGLENDSDMLASAYAACSVFVLPSMFETPGIAALEAGLAGAKIVITPHGGTKDYFGSMAEYVDYRSPESIRNGIVTALQRPASDTLQRHIENEFLWSRVAEKTLSFYQRSFK
jgi:glycosyltransferase involved in cell wall biosynthesis